MTGLDLETLLRLLRADLGTWVSLAAIAVVLALMTWTSWGKRRALRKCLVLSIAAHVGLLMFGTRLPLVQSALRPRTSRPQQDQRIRKIRVEPVGLTRREDGADSPDGRPVGRRLADWDAPTALPETLAMAGPEVRPLPLELPKPGPLVRAESPPTARPEPAMPEADLPTPAAPEDRRAPKTANAEAPPKPPENAAATDAAELALAAPVVEEEPAAAPAEPARPDAGPARPAADPVRPGAIGPRMANAVRPPDLDDIPPPPPGNGDSTPEDRPAVAGHAERPAVAPGPIDDTAGLVPPGGEPIGPVAPPTGLAMPDAGVRRPTARPQPGPLAFAPPARLREGTRPPTLDRALPAAAAPGLPEVGGRRSLPEVPEVYRSRLDPNRTANAQRAGASTASEQAVERALDWLARHQDADGRWNGGTAKFPDGTTARGDHDFTQHCPPGEICSGQCYYWEADTAMTGLALLAFLGAGYTHTDGKYSANVDGGLQFLLRSQKADGDLRGLSQGVGMYCHAMASLALCEAYALTGDPKLRGPAERAVGWIVRSKSQDGMAWRYLPGDPSGSDTSILGWIILVLKSAKVSGIPVPDKVRDGAATWLRKVADGNSGGLAKYQPGEPVRASMTAEAWACRQFLGLGGPGAASDEAAAFLLAHGPDRDPYNLYYWYYGTLAMFQHGGRSWDRWNAAVRDQLVAHQQTGGHRAGSWDPEDSKTQYDGRGGRIYCTAVAALTLEVYYRYLRLYDTPASPTIAPADSPLRRASGGR